MTDFKNYCIRVLGKVHPRSTFLSIKNYRNNFSEISNFSVVFHASYLNAIKKSKNLIKTAEYSNNNRFNKLNFDLAKEELLNSFDMTLSGYNPLYTCQGVYNTILGSNNKPIPGIKLHIRQGIVHINALKFRKKIITPGIYKKVDSSQKTIAKRYLKKVTPLNNWIQFKLEKKRFDKLTVEHLIIKG